MLAVHDPQLSLERAYSSAMSEGVLHYLYVKRGKRITGGNSVYDLDLTEFNKRINSIDGALFISSNIPADRLKLIRREAFGSVVDGVVDSPAFRSPALSGLASELDGKRNLSIGIQEARKIGPTVRALLGGGEKQVRRRLRVASRWHCGFSFFSLGRVRLSRSRFRAVQTDSQGLFVSSF
jgi:hypothetical protein